MTLKEQIKYALKTCWNIEITDRKLFIFTPFFSFIICDFAHFHDGYDLIRKGWCLHYSTRFFSEVLNPYDACFNKSISKIHKSVSFKDVYEFGYGVCYK